jgi:hypothetical protein
MNKSFTIGFPIVLFLMLIIASCNSKDGKDKYNRTFHRAVNNKDTAILVLNRSKDRFYGQYEILYNKIGKDSGDVKGNIIGDTLKGSFHYISYGGSWKRAPLTLLKKDNKLFLGKGVIGTYLNIPCYLPEIPIDYSISGFVFEEIKTNK